MRSMDRVAAFAWFWFLGLIGAGLMIGRLFEAPGTGAVWGFLVAFFAVFAWPAILPRRVEQWMHEPL